MVRHSPHGDTANAMEDGSPAGSLLADHPYDVFPCQPIVTNLLRFCLRYGYIAKLIFADLLISENLINFACVSFKSDVVLTVFS